jgi:hypothetical protein
MVRTLLVRGMLVGIVAGLLAFGLAKIWGEPQVDLAIAFESAQDQARMSAMPGMSHGSAGAATTPAAEPEELVSRGVQSSVGLLIGILVYGTAFGGLFALTFAFAYGRIGGLGPRATAALLAAIGFVALVVVPGLKYPPNPPAVGDGATIAYRTGIYFAMLAVSLAAATAAVAAAGRLRQRYGGWNAALLAGAGFVAVIFAAYRLLPALNEVPETFPAVVLWRFRVASVGVELVLWTAIGLLFGVAAERVLAVRMPARA